MKKGDELFKLVYLTNEIPVMTIMIQFSGGGSDVWHLHSGFIEKKEVILHWYERANQSSLCAKTKVWKLF